MECERKGVTITWEIENVKYVGEKGIARLFSPTISVDEMDGTKWRLVILSMKGLPIRLSLRRESEIRGPNEFEIDYGFSAQLPDGKHLQVRRNCSSTFTGGQDSPMTELSDDEPYDSIIVRCQMWPRRRCISKNYHFSIHTPIKRERCAFVGVVENFSDLSGEVKTLKTVSSSDGKELMSANLRLARKITGLVSDWRTTYLKIDINRLNKDYKFYDFQVLFLNSVSKKINLGELKEEMNFELSKTFILPVTKEYLIENAAQYLPNNTLSLHCEITIYNDVEHKISKTNESDTDFVSKVLHRESLRVVEALTATKTIPCDVKIQTATETFPAHTEVLSAQSSVFEDMFRTMKDSAENHLHIDDFDAETVKRMLVFIYSTTLENLDWKDALKLHSASDKYQILSLKQSCSSFLEQNIDLSNCMVLLHLADMKKDDNLKSNVQNFVAENMLQVLHCNQWKDFEKDYPQIAIQLCHVLLRKHKLV